MDFTVIGFVLRRSYLRYYSIPAIILGAILLAAWLEPKEYWSNPIGLLFAMPIFAGGVIVFVIDWKLRQHQRGGARQQAKPDRHQLSGVWFITPILVIIPIITTIAVDISIGNATNKGFWNLPDTQPKVILLTVLSVVVTVISVFAIRKYIIRNKPS